MAHLRRIPTKEMPIRHSTSIRLARLLARLPDSDDLTSVWGCEDGSWLRCSSRGARCIEASNTKSMDMLELIEILRDGLPMTEPRTWLFIATVIAAGIAGWQSLNVVEHLAKNK